MTDKFLTTLALMLGAAWLAGNPTGATGATLAVPADFSSISAAFEASQPGDRVEISPGIYFENHLTLPNGISMIGVGADPGDVVINGRGTGRILLAESLDRTTLVMNLTFANGRAAGHTSYDRSGGAIFCSNSTLRITNCIFEGNVSDGHGGAIRCNNSAPLITGCVFRDNSANEGGGGAIDCSFDSSPLIRSCQFSGNSAAWGGALSCRGYSSPIVYGGLFETNAAVGNKAYGGAVFADFGSSPLVQVSTYVDNSARYGGALACLDGTQASLENCTLIGNEAQFLGGGLFAYNASPRIASSIFAFQVGTGISAEGTSAPVITCTDLYGNSRGDWIGSIAASLSVGDNIAADPLFCDAGGAASSPYSLNENSPCGIEDLACGYMGAWPIGCQEVGTTVSTFGAQWTADVASLSWQVRTLGGDTPQFRLTGMREGSDEGEWEVTFEDLGGGYFEAHDPQRASGDGATYIYRLYLAAPGGAWSLVDEVRLTSVPEFVGIQDLKCWPNPFNPMTTINFRLGSSQWARVSVFGADGRRVAVLAATELDAGPHSQTWDGRDSQGNQVGSGTYIVLVEGKAERLTQKVTLLK